MLVLAICYYVGDFSSLKIVEYMSWVGGLIVIVGGIITSSNNPYWGSSMAITTQLRHNIKGQKNEEDAAAGFVRGLLIAAPGVIMMA